MRTRADRKERGIHAERAGGARARISAFSAVTLAGVLLLLLAAMPAGAQISPGALSRAHAFLSGPTRCVECHDIAKSPPEFKCLDCHKDIQQRLDTNRGLHASLVGRDKPSEACIRCHSEHNGRDFALIHWEVPVRSFDHRRAAYTLEGKHARLICKDCHQPSHIAEDVRKTISVKDTSRTYLGLSRKCAGCHPDEHGGQLGMECERCHDSSGWKGAIRFDHSRASFPIEGAHQKAACAKCHPKTKDSKPYTKYKEISFGDCTPCHNDPHHGSFQAGCKSCHAPANWKPIAIASNFNHFRTEFPLLGKHATVPCKSCHANADFKARLTHAQCMDCHKADAHRGQFKARAGRGDCAECHKVEGFKPASFGAEQHQAGDFPLQGRHQTVPCAKCHPPKGADTVYRMPDIHCAGCHKDVHKAQFAGPAYRNSCEVCHTEKGFKPSTMTIARHNKSRFPLAGAHAAVVCAECHKNSVDGSDSGTTAAQYVFESRVCATCHEDPHEGEFSGRMKAAGPDGKPGTCDICHSTKSWQDLHGFEHAASAFPLEGAHRAVPCRDCHKSNGLETRKAGAVFNAAPQHCSGCHDDVHGGQFVGNWTSGECARCHRPSGWKPSTFDHQTGSGYELTGAHKNVPCALCHKEKREREGRVVLVYTGTPRTCSACHDSRPALEIRQVGKRARPDSREHPGLKPTMNR